MVYEHESLLVALKKHWRLTNQGIKVLDAGLRLGL